MILKLKHLIYFILLLDILLFCVHFSQGRYIGSSCRIGKFGCWIIEFGHITIGTNSNGQGKPQIADAFFNIILLFISFKFCLNAVLYSMLHNAKCRCKHLSVFFLQDKVLWFRWGCIACIFLYIFVFQFGVGPIPYFIGSGKQDMMIYSYLI